MDTVKLPVFTPLLRINNENGNILRGLKKSEQDFSQFGEAYFSFILQGKVKGWKRHNRMSLNIIVPIGNIKFVLYHEKENHFTDFIIGESNYGRLNVPPGYWMAFMGIDSQNLLLNIADIEHDPLESDAKDLKEIKYSWI